MKKTILNVLAIAFVLTTMGFLMDGDIKESSMAIRFMEYGLMLAITFTILTLGYFSVRTAYSKIRF